MDDSEPNNNSTHIHVLQTKGEKHEGHTVQPRHETKTRQCPLLHDICHLSCNEQNSNVVAPLYRGAHHDTFNSSSLYILYTEFKKTKLTHCLHLPSIT
jgi:hypothetical protein